MTQEKNSSPLLIAAAWIVVIIPAAWGLNYTVQNALKLFTAAPPSAAPASSSQSAPPVR